MIEAISDEDVELVNGSSEGDRPGPETNVWDWLFPPRPSPQLALESSTAATIGNAP